MNLGTTDFKVLKHPDKNEIIDRISKGESVRDVQKWLAERYPRDPRKHIAFMTLQKFRKKYLNLEGDVLKEVKDEKRRLEKERKDKQNIEAFKQSGGYDELKSKAAEKVIDIGSTLDYLQEKIKTHIRLLEGEELNAKNSRAITDLIGQYRQLMVDAFKMFQKMEEKKDSQEIKVNHATEQVNILKEAIRETLAELEPEKVAVFMMKLKEKASVYRSGGFQVKVDDEGSF